MNYCKLHICVDIFHDKGLIEFRPATMKISYVVPKQKVNLEDSETLVKLNEMLGKAGN